ncbi:MAG: hypothetical protein B6D56_00090 [Candidatus Omnitrophica bacterium 4484_70.1]|nr:MAG: hypothetical protein B6D56_00090 [Candidatus Omnitrophica bacterium 4484_70.1]
MKKYFFLLLLLGCGYSTYLVNIKDIYVKPVTTSVNLTGLERAYSEYTSYPLFLDKLLTNKIIEEINLRGASINNSVSAYRLETNIYRYEKEGLRYEDNDEVSEQRLKLFVKVKLFSPQDELIKEKKIIGQTTFFLSGPYKISEEEAIQDLIEDTAQRIVETIISDW